MYYILETKPQLSCGIIYQQRKLIEVDCMKILVAGGAGYIGSHTVVELINNDYEVVIVDNFSNSSPIVLDRIKQITNQEVICYNVDILDKKALEKVFQENDIAAVLHFAAYKAVGESVEKPLMYYKNNIEGTIVLAELMNQYNVKKMVYSSSATVYGTENPSPLNETMPTFTATNPYGYTKIVNEALLKDLAYSDNEWGVTLLRYFNPIGAHESGLIGEDPKGIPNNIMPYITQVAVGKRSELSVFGDDYDTADGTGVRDYIHVVDLAKGHVKAIEELLNHNGTHIYNLGTGEGYSVLDLVKAFESASGVEIPYKITARRAGDVAVVYANPELAEKVLGWTAEKNLEEMCQDSWRWQENNPNGYE